MSWVDSRAIPVSKPGSGKASWMDDENLKESIRYFASLEKDRLTSYRLGSYLNQRTDCVKNIKLRTARNWLNQLGFKYSDKKKDVYIDGHKRPDVVEYRMRFFTEMDNLGPYLVEFEADGSIKNKIYPAGCQVDGENCRPINVITHDECTFSADDGLSRAWKDPNRSFL
ncbi:hypothetical protein K3495_g5683 [Podosphaera aphanis]|nr:hypothetical protein K3495_g5683 [Podosphaera aphanis]